MSSVLGATRRTAKTRLDLRFEAVYGTQNETKITNNQRFTGAFDAADLGELVLDWRDGRPVRLRDIAEVRETLVDRKSFVISQGARSIAVNAHREIGVNVLDVMDGLREAAPKRARREGRRPHAHYFHPDRSFPASRPA